MSETNVFREAGKIATRLKHWGRKRDEAIDRARNAYNAGLRKVLLAAGPEVASALVHQGLVHQGFVDHLFGFQDAVFEADAGAGPSELDRFAQAACGGPAAQALADAAMTAPDLVPRAQ